MSGTYSGTIIAAPGVTGLTITGDNTVTSTGIVSGGDGATSLGGGDPGGVGIDLQSAGTLSNAGTISGGDGGSASGGGSGGDGGVGIDVHGLGTVSNSGVISGGNGASGGGSTNDGHGATAVDFFDGGTLANAGTISGGTTSGGANAAAVFFGSGDSRLIVESGATFNGNVTATAAFYNVLELAGSAHISGIGIQFAGFDQVDAGLGSELDGTNTVGIGRKLTLDGALTNAGTLTVSGTLINNAVLTGGTSDLGVSLAGGGTLLNNGSLGGGYATSGAAPRDGVEISNGTVVNAGLISGGGSGGYLHNGGIGVNIAGNGIVNNTNTGTIRGGAGGGSFHGGTGVNFVGGGTLTSAGTISSGPGLEGVLGYAVHFGNGNAHLTMFADAVFNGQVAASATLTNDVLELGSSANAGTISGIGSQFTGFDQVQVDAAAVWTLGDASANTIGGGRLLANEGFLTNSGSLTIAGAFTNDETFTNANVLMTSGTLTNQGIFTNADSGALTISGTLDSFGTLNNAGALTVDGTLDNSGTLNNAGALTVDGALTNDSILTNAGNLTVTGGLVNNGIVSGTSGGPDQAGHVGISIAGGGSLVNHGTVDGGHGGLPGTGSTQGSAGGNAVNLQSGGLLTNDGTIHGGGGSNAQYGGPGGIGINFVAGGTLIDSGTISGGDGGSSSGGAPSGARGSAVHFGNGNAHLTLLAGAVFNGQVVASASLHNDVLELGSSTNTGTISGIGTQFTGFDQLQVDSAAAWDLAGSNTLASGVALINAGNLTVTGGNLVNNGAVSGAGGGSNQPGHVGISIASSGTLVNHGTVDGGHGGPLYASSYGSGGGTAIELQSGGLVTNDGTVRGGGGTNAEHGGLGGIGVNFAAGGTLIDSGTISGGDGGISFGFYPSGARGTAVYFGNGDAHLRLLAGAVFTGQVVASATLTNDVLELGSSASAGTISGIGTQFTGFDQVLVDSGAVWNLAGSNVLGTVTNNGVIQENAGDQLTINGPLDGQGMIQIDPSTVTLNGAVHSGETLHFLAGNNTLQLGDIGEFVGTIDGLAGGGSVDLVGIANVTDSHLDPGGVLTLDVGGGGTVLLHLGDPESFTGKFFHFTSDGNGGTSVSVDDNSACYCPGTLILTDHGEVAVETLQIGDRVVTLSGAWEPICWIGRRSYAGRFLAGKKHILPIRIQAGALAEGLPRRDLWISPQHAMYLDGVLVEAKDLINRVSILQEDIGCVDYIHIELASHDVIWAEGAASETFIDDDSRGLFHNAFEYAQLHPEAARTIAQYCAPRLSEGYALETIRGRLAQRAEELRRVTIAKAAQP